MTTTKTRNKEQINPAKINLLTAEQLTQLRHCEKVLMQFSMQEGLISHKVCQADVAETAKKYKFNSSVENLLAFKKALIDQFLSLQFLRKLYDAHQSATQRFFVRTVVPFLEPLTLQFLEDARLALRNLVEAEALKFTELFGRPPDSSFKSQAIVSATQLVNRLEALRKQIHDEAGYSSAGPSRRILEDFRDLCGQPIETE